MKPKELMNEKFDLLLDEIRRIKTSVTEDEQILEDLEYRHHQNAKLLSVKERMALIHSRLEGLSYFVQECKRVVQQKETKTTEEPDLWF